MIVEYRAVLSPVGPETVVATLRSELVPPVGFAVLDGADAYVVESAELQLRGAEPTVVVRLQPVPPPEPAP